MKNSKNYSKTAIVLVSFLLLSLTSFAQDVKNVEIEGTDQMKFSVESIEVTSGQKFTVKLVNNSRLPSSAMSHNYVLLKENEDADAFDKAGLLFPNNGYIDPKLKTKMIAHTNMISGGKTGEVTIIAPRKRGKYIYICTFPGHFDAGMKGVLIVK